MQPEKPELPILLGYSSEEISELVRPLGLPPFAGRQIARWLYEGRAAAWDEMTDISKANRLRLSESFNIGRRSPACVQTSKDGTRKYLFPTGSGQYVETVMIPDGDRYTLCVSSQAGCRMNCSFCMTGRSGGCGRLTRADILNQVLSTEEFADLTNIVFMGMGEPLDNTDEVLSAIGVLTGPRGLAWSPKRITLSTIGPRTGLRRFLTESRCHLAVSLHNPIHEERLAIMPCEAAFPIAEIVEMLRAHNFGLQRRLSFEYIVFTGVNDSPHHADALADLLRGLDCRINLIRFHRIPACDLPGTTDASIGAFHTRLETKGFRVTERRSRGEDIAAACGMLSALEGRGNPLSGA